MTRAISSELRNVTVLSVLQALLLTAGSATITLNVLAGHKLSLDKSLATLPVTGSIVGGAATALGASLLMERIGRRAGFTLGALIGLLGALVCSVAIHFHSFWTLVAGASIFGVSTAFGQFYRFAAADASRPERKARAVSYVLAGGLVGGLSGPLLARATVHLLPEAFLASYLALGVPMLIAVLVLRLLDLPAPSVKTAREPKRPFRTIVTQPPFVVAVSCSAIAYFVMTLLMTATPLSMGICGHPFESAASVISAHVFAMYAPALVTGDLIRRFGVSTIMLCGVALTGASIACALSGVNVAWFGLALVLLGVGWNFIYIGATTLLAESCHASEQAHIQGVNDTAIFVMMACASLASGLVLRQDGWRLLNYLSVPPIALLAGMVLWYARERQNSARRMVATSGAENASLVAHTQLDRLPADLACAKPRREGTFDESVE